MLRGTRHNNAKQASQRMLRGVAWSRRREGKREEGEEPKLLSIFPEKMMLHIIRRRPPVRPRPTRGKNYGRLRFLAIAARAFLIGVTEGTGRKQTRNDVTATVC